MKEYRVELRARRFWFSLLPRKFAVEVITHSPQDARMTAIAAVMQKGYEEKRIEVTSCTATERKVSLKAIGHDFQEYVAE